MTMKGNTSVIEYPRPKFTRPFAFAEKNIPAFTVQPTQKLANHASFEGVVIPVAGTWTLEVLAVYSGETVRFSTPVTIR